MEILSEVIGLKIYKGVLKMNIKYEDVCKNNSVLEQLFKELSPELVVDSEGLSGIRYGYCKASYDETTISISVDRNKTRAGNQYIVLSGDSWMYGSFKIPMGTEISREKIIKMLDKSVAKKRELDAESNKIEAQRKQISKLMSSTDMTNLSFSWTLKRVYNLIDSYIEHRYIGIGKDFDVSVYEGFKDEAKAKHKLYMKTEAKRLKLQELIDVIVKK
jgi:hypothetical protein